MVTFTNARGITLSANASANGCPVILSRIVFSGRGDFAERLGGRIRRNERRARIAAKAAWVNG
jgi:hypothetical protein